MGASGCETEAYKLMISDISTCTPGDESGVFIYTLAASDLCNTNNANGKGSGSRSRGKQIKLRVKLVWIQGNIVNIQEEGGEKILVIANGSHKAKVLGFSSVPGGDHPKIRAGSYVAILGDILSTAPIRIRAIKVTCPENETLLESMWDEEVRDLKLFLLDISKPVLVSKK